MYMFLPAIIIWFVSRNPVNGLGDLIVGRTMNRTEVLTISIRLDVYKRQEQVLAGQNVSYTIQGKDIIIDVYKRQGRLCLMAGCSSKVASSKGIVSDATMNTVTIVTDKNDTLSFSTMDANKEDVYKRQYQERWEKRKYIIRLLIRIMFLTR